MSTEVQTMADFNDVRPAMRTPLYPIISVFGLVMVLATFLTWATADNPEGGAGLSVSGLDAGGWGLAAIISGLAIAALGVLGYFWNPFSDPEAAFIGGFGLAAVIAALAKIASPTSLFSDSEAFFDFFDVDGSAGVGLWLVLLAALASFISAAWILFSRPRAENALT